MAFDNTRQGAFAWIAGSQCLAPEHLPKKFTPPPGICARNVDEPRPRAARRVVREETQGNQCSPFCLLLFIIGCCVAYLVLLWWELYMHVKSEGGNSTTAVPMQLQKCTKQ